MIPMNGSMCCVIPGQGSISTKILKQILHEIDENLSDVDLDNIIEEVDEDGSGTVDFDGESRSRARLPPTAP
jgi:hypothetical protein